jgi:hypothetical protein
VAKGGQIHPSFDGRTRHLGAEVHEIDDQASEVTDRVVSADPIRRSELPLDRRRQSRIIV